MAAPAPTWKLEADFDFDDTYEEDLTSRIPPGSSIAITRGVDDSGNYKVSQFGVTLSNKDGYFSPGNTSSGLANRSRIDVPVRVVVTWDSTDYQIWTGYIRNWQYEWAAEHGPSSVANSATITCYDIADYLQRSEPVNVLVSKTRDTDAALVAIMDALGLTASDRDFDDGVQDLPLHFVSGQEALSAMMQVVISEMGGFLWTKANGALRFESRAARLGSTPDRTWGDGTNIKARRASGETSRDLVVTGARVRGVVFREDQAGVEVFRFSRGADTEDSLQIGAGETWGPYDFNAQAAYSALTAPVATTDYVANSAQDGSGTDRTSDLDVDVTSLGGSRFRLKMTETGGSNALYVTKFKLRGQPANFYADRPEAVVTKSVAGVKAGTSIEVDVPFVDENGQQLLSYAWQLARTYRWSMPPLPLAFSWSHDDIVAEMLAVEIGDLVQYTDTAAGDASGYHDDLYRVEQIRIVAQPGRIVRSEVMLSQALEYRNLDAIAYDDFKRSNASGSLGKSLSRHDWADDSGFDIASEAARANTDTLSMANVDLGTGITDQVVEVSLAAIGAGDEVGCVFLYADANNHCRAYLDKGSNEVILERVVSGTVTELASPSFTVGASHEIRVVVQGDRIRAWVDFEPYIDDATGSLPSGTKVGLMARSASGTTTFDDFYANGL